jgi:hypothetical protein
MCVVANQICPLAGARLIGEVTGGLTSIFEPKALSDLDLASVATGVGANGMGEWHGGRAEAREEEELRRTCR